MEFSHITSVNGLSQNHGLCIIQDYKGFMWFGTEGGLNKYDGYKFSVYRNNPEDSLSLSNDMIYALLEDADKNLWVATNNGLNLYKRNRNNFQRFHHNPNNSNSLTDNVVHALYEDKEGQIWIGTSNGLNVYKKKEQKIYRLDSGRNLGRINAIVEDQQQNLWIGAEKGLFLYDSKKETFINYGQPEVSAFAEDGQRGLLVGLRYEGLRLFDLEKKRYTKEFRHQTGDESSLGNDVVYKLYKDKEGNIWVGTENGGLNLFDPATGSFTRFVHHSFDAGSISNNTVSAIYEDKSGILWVGVHRGGINYYDPRKERFRLYQVQAGRSSISHNNIKAFAEDKAGNIWIGTDGGGLNFWNRETGTFTHFKHDPHNPNSLSNDVVVYVYIDRDENVWASTFQGGLNKYDVAKKKFTHYRHQAANAASIGNDFVWCIFEDKNGNLWISTRGAGLSYFDKKTNRFTAYQAEAGTPNTLSSNYINVLFEDSKGNFWVGTNMGLNLFDRNSKKVTASYSLNKDNPASISDGDITVIYEDRKHNLWVGTRNGLNLYDYTSGSFKVYTRKDGLPNTNVVSIQEDEEGNLWLGTQMGLTKFNPEQNTFKTYTAIDGLQGDEFTQNAALRTRNGELMFGGINGFNVFRPDRIRDNDFVPPVSITDFLVFNKSVEPDSSSLLQEHITEASEITLSYRESVFSFEFAAQNYTLPEKNQYAYMMEGFDTHWNKVGAQRKATYTNLDPGNYIFRVKATNNDGVWNEEGTSIAVFITPPFWQTWWFRSLLALGVIGGAFTFYKVRMNAIKEQKELLEKKVNEQTADIRQANDALLERQEEIMQQQEEMQAQADLLLQINENLKSSQSEIALQRDALQVINEKVMSSITYAQTIQKAILPAQEKIKQFFPEHFILYRPKDVVSGDFYWYAHLAKEETGLATDFHFMAVVDCTGHGVPGAFMSIIGSTLLNEIVNQKKIVDPALILEELHLGVKKAVEKAEGVNTAGMDVCLCRLEIGEGYQTRLLFSGAKRNLLFIRKESSTLEKLVADRRSIGSDSALQFTNQELVLETGSMLYFTSDGYVDQNNPEREKLGSAQLEKLILQAVNRSAEEQKVLFETALDQHQQDSEQRDDITVLGIRL